MEGRQAPPGRSSGVEAARDLVSSSGNAAEDISLSG